MKALVAVAPLRYVDTKTENRTKSGQNASQCTLLLSHSYFSDLWMFCSGIIQETRTLSLDDRVKIVLEFSDFVSKFDIVVLKL